MACRTCQKDNVYYGNGFGLGITTDQSGESWLGGKKIVSWSDDMPITYDSKTGQMFANILNMNTGQYMTGIAMPTTIAARGGGRGPIATAPTGSGRVFWAEEDCSNIFVAGIVLGAVCTLISAVVIFRPAKAE